MSEQQPEARPYVNVYEGEPPTLVYREMTEDEYAQHERDLTTLDDGAWQAFRVAVAARLEACDWTQLADTPSDGLGRHDDGSLVTLEEWTTYRDELRALPAQTTDPRLPDWPTPPASPAYVSTLPINTEQTS